MNRSLALSISITIASSTLLPLTTAHADHGQIHPQDLPGWTPIPFPDFTLPAGSFCPFTLQVDVLQNGAIGTTTKTFADGSPQQQIFMGPQLIRLTNVETGNHTVTFLDGIQIFDYAADGSFVATNIGKNMIGIRSPESFPVGFYFVDGYHLVEFVPGSGSLRMLQATGVESSYCDTLKGHEHDRGDRD